MSIEGLGVSSSSISLLFCPPDFLDYITFLSWNQFVILEVHVSPFLHEMPRNIILYVVIDDLKISRERMTHRVSQVCQSQVWEEKSIECIILKKWKMIHLQELCVHLFLTAIYFWLIWVLETAPVITLESREFSLFSLFLSKRNKIEQEVKQE